MVNPHTDLIVAAYMVALVVILGTLVAVMLDYRAQKRALARLERRGGEEIP